MYPAQTSLIPVTVAITRFLESNGFSSFFGVYPYWYLGVPARYLAGPVVPFLLIGLHKILPNVTLFSITIYLIIFSFLASAAGWGVLAKRITGKRNVGVIVGILLLILPWRYLSSLALDESSNVLARNLLPYVLLAFWNFLKRKDRKSTVIVLAAIVFLLLINTNILTILIVGITGLVLAASFKKGKIKKVSKYIKPSLLILAGGLFLVTFWYTPSYWWTVLTNPSIGGASQVKVILRVFDLLRVVVPLVLAMAAVYFSGKIKSRFSVFGLTWTFTFLFLTAFRFIGDPDFWQDWTSWVFELEIGIAFLISILVSRKRYFVSFILFLALFLLTNYIYGVLKQPTLISSSLPRGVLSLKKLDEIARDERVFISGSTVFWANALTDLAQVRGGVDKVAIHPFWDHAAYQLREGSSPELASAWLEALGVSYVLIHGPYSLETYHDFRNIDKWLNVGEVVWEGQGDAIIKVPEASLAWVVNLNKLEKVKQPPKSGEDLDPLSLYLSAKKRPVEVIWEGPGKIVLKPGQLEESEGVVLAVSFDSAWQSSVDFRLRKDPLGNILLIPRGFVIEAFDLIYKQSRLAF